MNDSVSKYHHYIPQTYLKSWSYNNQTVHLYDKSTCSFDDRNTNSIFGKNYFHSIKAGSLYTTKDALNKIFSTLDNFTVEYLNNVLVDEEDLNKYFYDYDKWTIYYPDGNRVGKKEKNRIKQQLSTISDDTLEKKWSEVFESRWPSLIDSLYDRLRKSIDGELDYPITEEDFRWFQKFYIMFDWRRTDSNDQFNEIINIILSGLPDLTIPENERTYKYDACASAELKHAVLLHMFEQLIDDKQAMKSIVATYYDNLTLGFLLNRESSFITSDNPCYQFENEEGVKCPILVATPKVIITLLKKPKDWKGEIVIRELDSKEVDYYNEKTFVHGNQVVFLKKESMLQYIQKDSV